MTKTNKKGGVKDQELQELHESGEAVEKRHQKTGLRQKISEHKQKLTEFKIQGMELKPSTLLMFYTMIAPLFVAFTLVIISFMNGDIKGIVYLAGVLFATIFGGLLSPMFGDAEPQQPDHCQIFKLPFNVNFSSNFSLNALFLGFTFSYLTFPMMTSGDYNIPIFIFLLLTLVMNNYIKMMQGCSRFIGLLLGSAVGIGLGIAWFSIFSATGYKSITYFDLGKSNNVQCSKASKDTFKCRVLKNGQVIANI